MTGSRWLFNFNAHRPATQKMPDRYFQNMIATFNMYWLAYLIMKKAHQAV